MNEYRNGIGSFIEHDLEHNIQGEYHERYLLNDRTLTLARLNTARAGIYHAIRSYQATCIRMPYYICPTIKIFLERKGIKVDYYHLGADLTPLSESANISNESCTLIVNYYGLFDTKKLNEISSKFKKVIIDNSQAFYTPPITNTISVYSARKFVGVTDGSYVIGNNVIEDLEYEQDMSSEHMQFLFLRHEYGSSSSYGLRMENERRLTNADVLRMSSVTRKILTNIDHRFYCERRKLNFLHLHCRLHKINNHNITDCYNTNSVPMIYPLLILKNDMDEILKVNNIYTGRWWDHVLKLVENDSIEAKYSKYLVPIPIDHRYTTDHMDYIVNTILRSI